jgi:hypothetical protein
VVFIAATRLHLDESASHVEPCEGLSHREPNCLGLQARGASRLPTLCSVSETGIFDKYGFPRTPPGLFPLPLKRPDETGRVPSCD